MRSRNHVRLFFVIPFIKNEIACSEVDKFGEDKEKVDEAMTGFK